MKMYKDLKKLARELTIEEISELVLLKSNECNINSEINDKIRDSLTYANALLSSLNEMVNNRKIGYIVRRSFNEDKAISNIDSLIELVYNRNVEIKRKYLNLDYSVLKFLKITGYIEITKKDITATEKSELIQATDKLVSFIEQYKSRTWDFKKINLHLIDSIIIDIFSDNGLVKNQHWGK